MVRIVESEVILRGRRAIFRDWGSPSRPKSQGLISPSKLPWFWSYPVLVEKVTLRDLFALLGRVPASKLRAIECLAQSNIRPFLAEAQMAGGAKKRHRLTKITVSPEVSVDDHFRDLILRSEALGQKPGRRERYALSLCPIAEVLDCEIRIEPRAKVTRFRRRADEEDIGSYEYNLTLGDLLTAIFHELAFFGTPKQREAFSRELSRRIEEADSGKERGIPAEQVFRELRRRRLRRRRRTRSAAERGRGS